MTPRERPSSDEAAVVLTVDDDLAVVTLARPQAANTIDVALAEGLRHAVLEAAGSGARALLLQGTGRFFCAGADLKALTEAPEGIVARLERVIDPLHDAINALAALPMPVVAAVNGPAAGAGLAFVLAADIAVAAASATFSSAYRGVGLSPDAGCSWRLPRLVGERRALELFLLNRALSATEAHRSGIVHEVVPDDQLDARALEVARSLATGPTLSLAAARLLVRESWARPLDEHLDAERASLLALGASADADAAIRAFVDKAAVVFRGR